MTMKTQKTGSPAKGTLKKVVFSIILLTCILTFCGLILELGAYVYLNKVKGYSTKRSATGIELDPFRNYQLIPGFHTGHLSYNSQGFRRLKPVARLKPKGTYRIFLMGGSTAFGSDALAGFPKLLIHNNETISHYLENILNSANTNLTFEVINAAVSGYRTHHHLVYLNQKLLSFDPDMILFLDGHNDHYICDPAHEQFTVSVKDVEKLNELNGNFVAELNIRYLSRKSWLFYGIYLYLKRRQSWQKHYSDKATGDLACYEEIARRTFLKMIKRNVLILKDEGIVPLVFLQPELILQSPGKLSRADRNNRAIELKLRDQGYEENMTAMYHKLVPLLETLAREYGFVFRDLNPIFHDKEDHLFADYCHLTPDGNRRIAEIMSKTILPIVQTNTRRANEPHPTSLTNH